MQRRLVGREIAQIEFMPDIAIQHVRRMKTEGPLHPGDFFHAEDKEDRGADNERDIRPSSGTPRKASDTAATAVCECDYGLA